MAKHPITWTVAAPFWDALPQDAALAARLSRPALLRFANDGFMDELFATLASDPASLRRFEAVHETWRGPAQMATGVPAEQWTERKSSTALRLERIRNAAAARNIVLPAPTAGRYKLTLYQPAHQRFYLVCANLVCGIAGLPDRAVDAGRQERASFVLRRLIPADPALANPAQPLPAYDPAHADQWREYAYVSSDAGTTWQPLDDPDNVAEGEERLPLFPAAYAMPDERRRRLFAGLVPVAKREAYLGAPRRTSTNAPPAQPPDSAEALVLLFRVKALAPWKQLIDRAIAMQLPDSALNDAANPATGRADFLRTLRAQAQTASWYMLLDIADFLQQNLRDVWDAIVHSAPGLLGPEARALYDAIDGIATPPALASDLATSIAGYPSAKIATSLSDALRRIGAFAQILEDATAELVLAPHGSGGAPAGWPDFLFVFADAVRGSVLPVDDVGVAVDGNETPSEHDGRRVDALADKVRAALIARGAAPPPAVDAVPVADPRDGWFVIRCVYERPECGALDPKIVSAPTAAFQLAGYFDPDAPARPIRIGLPVDTTPAGLRKFDKKTMFVMSNILCGQIDRMKGMTFGDLIRQVLPWPLHKDLSLPEKGPCTDPGSGLSLGVICSLSIPIITLCALILLMIMVSLLDFIFRWLPWFVICLPLPGFKGKKPFGS